MSYWNVLSLDLHIANAMVPWDRNWYRKVLIYISQSFSCKQDQVDASACCSKICYVKVNNDNVLILTFQEEKQTKNFNHIILSFPPCFSMKQHGDTFYYMEMFSWKEGDPSTRSILIRRHMFFVFSDKCTRLYLLLALGSS